MPRPAIVTEGYRVLLGTTRLPVPRGARVTFPGVEAAARAGSTEHFDVYFDEVLGESGRFVASTVLNRAERDLNTLQRWFGTTQLPDRRERVVLARLPEDARARRSGTGDAVLYCDVETVPRLEALQSCFYVGLLVAGRFVAAHDHWDAGSSDGDALARVLATAMYPRRIIGFATAWTWLEGERADFVHATGAPDNPQAIGCAVLFLNYLHHQLGYSWQEIVASGSTTLAATARSLGADEPGYEAYDEFRALVDGHFPAGEVVALETDNPFPFEPPTARNPSQAASSGLVTADGPSSN